MLKNRTIFITGATGFVGTKLAFYLKESNHVIALLREKSREKANYFEKNGVAIKFGDFAKSFGSFVKSFGSFAREFGKMQKVLEVLRQFP